MGSRVISVFGGPADRVHYQTTNDYVAKKIPLRNYTEAERITHEIFSELRTLREKVVASSDLMSLRGEFDHLKSRLMKLSGRNWLQTMELLEIRYLLGLSSRVQEDLKEDLQNFVNNESTNVAAVLDCVQSGIRIAPVQL
jgi:phenylalanine-4-hydroxylase